MGRGPPRPVPRLAHEPHHLVRGRFFLSHDPLTAPSDHSPNLLGVNVRPSPSPRLQQPANLPNQTDRQRSRHLDRQLLRSAVRQGRRARRQGLPSRAELERSRRVRFSGWKYVEERARVVPRLRERGDEHRHLWVSLVAWGAKRELMRDGRLNNYEWCGDSTYEASGYARLTTEFAE